MAQAPLFSRSRVVRALLPWLVPLILLAVWQGCAQSGVVNRRLLPAPSDVALAGWHLFRHGELLVHLSQSLHRALLGLAVGGGLGLILGLASGLTRTCETLLDTSLQMVRTIPHLALIPLTILWFGIGESSKLFLISLGTFFPIYLNTFHGIRQVDPKLLEAAKVYQIRGPGLIWHVLLPGALPSILVGLRYALGVMWVTLIVAETIATQTGIGFLINEAREFMQTPVILVGILVYAALGKVADVFTRGLERLCLPWISARLSTL